MSHVEKLKNKLLNLRQIEPKQEDVVIKIPKNKDRVVPSLRVDNENINFGELYNFCITDHTTEFDQHLNNIVSIWSMPPFPGTTNKLNKILNFIKKNKKDEKTLYFFDNIHEGHVISCVTGIHQIINHLKLDHTKVYFFSGGMNAQEIYNEYCENHGVNEKINIRVVNQWERNISDLAKVMKQPSYDLKEKEKTFLCFNRNARRHRIALLGLLYSKNLVEKSYYSFFPEHYNTTIDQMINWIGGTNSISSELLFEIKRNINLNSHKFPLLLNTHNIEENANYVKETDQEYYQNSYFSLVTETFFFKDNNLNFDEHSIFFSEKIFKPIACKHPFIQLNRPRSLEYLRKIGYKTFHPFIDESYDAIENDEQRLLEIVKEVNRLSQQTNDQWIDWQKNVFPIIDHNFNVLINKDKNKGDFYFYE